MIYTFRYRILAIALLFMVAPAPGMCQVNEYLNHNPIWQVNSQCAVPLRCIQNEDYNYFVNGDTIFNGLTYKKIYRKGTGFYSWFAPPPVGPGCSGTYSYNNNFSEHFVRSDNKQMYVRNYGDTSEYLLYDFDLAIGDTLPVTYNNFSPGSYVTAIDSFLTPYGYRKKFTLGGNTWATELLEGIGHNRGFLEPVSTPLECGFTLNCFSLNDTSYYPNAGLTCELAVGVKDDPEIFNLAVVAPNPFRNVTTITWNTALKNAGFRLFDTKGKIVCSMESLSGKSMEFNRENLEPGIYFFEIREVDANLFFSGKFIIQY